MDEKKIERAWLAGFVKPHVSPNYVLPLRLTELAQRDGVMLLRELISLLRRLLLEGRRLRGNETPLVTVIDVTQFPFQVAVVEVDLERGRNVELPFDPQTSSEEGNCEMGPGAEQEQQPALGAPECPPPQASGIDIVGAVGADEVHAAGTSLPAQPSARESADAPTEGGERCADEETKTDRALWMARDILKRFSAGELQTYDEMTKAISASPMPDLTRRYVAKVRSTDPDIVTARGLLRWTGLEGVRDPLPESAVAWVNIRCWDCSEQSTSAVVQVLRLHSSSNKYSKILDPGAVYPRPLMIDVDVPSEDTRALLEIAMPKGWSIRAVVSVGRLLLSADLPTLTVIHAELPPQLSPEACKMQIDSLIDRATPSQEQPGLWD